MARKRAALIGAATRAFLVEGFAEASVNRIALDAGVSIKTLYRHFESKDDLFNAVIDAACGPEEGTEADAARLSAWMALPPQEAFFEMGADYLTRSLDRDNIALYRVIVAGSARTSDLARRYEDRVVRRRDRVFTDYLELWSARSGWTLTDSVLAARSYAGLLRSGPLEDALLGGEPISRQEIDRHVKRCARQMLLLLEHGLA